jgi:hypothetical protein
VSAPGLVLTVTGVVAVVAVVSWFLLHRNDPEDAASHPEPARTGSALYHGDVNDRPGGPGAEADGVAGPGEPVPGPSAEAATDAGGRPS